MAYSLPHSSPPKQSSPPGQSPPRQPSPPQQSSTPLQPASPKQLANMQYEIAELEPDIPPIDRHTDGEDLYKLTLLGYPMYKRVGQVSEEQKRNIPIFIPKSFVQFLQMTPVYFLTRDLGMAYCFHRMDYIQLQCHGYANCGKFGQTACISHDLFKTEKLRLGPKFSMLDRPPEEQEILILKGSNAGSKRNRVITQKPEVQLTKTAAELCEYLDQYDSDEEYDRKAESGIITILKFHRAWKENAYSHGLAVYYDEFKHRYHMVKPKREGQDKAYILYLVPGRDECIEIVLKDTKPLSPLDSSFGQLEHFGLVFLVYHINRIGQSFPEGKGFKYALKLDEPASYHSNLVDQIHLLGYNSATQKHTVALNIYGENRVEEHQVAAWIIHQLEGLEKPIEITTKTEMSAMGYRLYSEHEPTFDTPRQPTAKCVRMAPVLVDPKEEIGFDDYVERLQEINDTLEQKRVKLKKPDYNIDSQGQSQLMKSNMRKMLDLIFKHIMEQNDPRNKEGIMDLKVRQVNELKAMSSEHRKVEMERKLRHLWRFDPDNSEIESLQTQLPPNGEVQSFVSRQDAEKLWMEGELILQRIKEEYEGNIKQGFAKTPAERLKTCRNSYYMKQGIPRLAEIRINQIYKHQHRCPMHPCEH